MKSALFGFALLSLGSAHAAEWDASFHPALVADSYVPAAQSRSDVNGIWVLGHARFESVLVRYDPAGNALATGHADLDHSVLVNTPDGGVLAFRGTEDGQICEPRYYDAGGRFRWQGSTCAGSRAQVAFDGRAGTWLVWSPNQVLDRLAADGAVVFRQDPFGEDVARSVAADPTAASAYVAGSLPVAGGTRRALVERINTNPTQFPWRWSDPGMMPSEATEIVRTSDGRLTAIGTIGGDAEARLLVLRLTGGGTLEHSEGSAALVPRAAGIDGYSGSLVAASDGAAYAIVRAAGDAQDRLVRISAAGTVAWNMSLSGWSCNCNAVPQQGGGVALLLERTAAGGGTERAIRRFRSDGSTMPDEPLPTGSPYYDVQRLLRDGTRVALQTSASPVAGSRYADATLDELGNSYLLTWNFDYARLDQLTAGGEAKTLDAQLPDFSIAQVGTGGGRTCVSLTRGLMIEDHPQTPELMRCRDDATGALRGEYPGTNSMFEVRADSIRYLSNSGALREVGLDGAVRTVFQDSTLLVYEFQSNAQGQTSLFGAGNTIPNTRKDAVLDAGEALRYAPFVEPQQFGYANPHGRRLLDDGSLLLAGLHASGFVWDPITLALLRPDGSLAWTRTLDDSYRQLWSAEDDTGIYIGLGDFFVQEGFTPKALVLKLSRSDGSELWRQAIDASLVPFTGPAIWRDPSSNRLLVQTTGERGLHFRTLDAATGAVLAKSTRSCGGPACELLSVELVDGRLQAAVQLDPLAGQGLTALFRIDDAFAEGMARVRPDQHALEGVWFNAATSGQGLVLDYIDAAHTMFLTWFTHPRDGDLSGNELQWYTLQGTVAPGASSVALDIYQNDGGNFATGPSTAATKVGTATLRFTDCGRALLEYDFDFNVNGGLSGVISLDQLTPSGSGCAALGEAPPPFDPVSAHGFEQRQSGTWYEPARGGQGFSLVVRPSADPSAGYVFGAWFTYKPSGSFDGGGRHWFTLQGGLSGASDGTVTLPIYRTIDGVFDRLPTANTSRVGTATLRFSDCAHATIDYQFDADVARAYLGKSGHLELSRVGACEP